MKNLRTVLLFLLFLALMGPIASAETFHVSSGGSDQADCSSTAPCLTISHGVSSAVPGDTVIVHAGVYRERVTVTQSGNATAAITIRAEGHVEMDGFRVDGHWIVIEGFYVDHGCVAGAPRMTTCRYTGTAGTPNPFGFWLAGSNITIRKNYVTGTHWGGVYSRGARNQILQNRFIRTGHPGVTVDPHGGHNIVEGNEIADVMSYRYGLLEQFGQDQDGIRLFGNGHIIRNNYIHDIYLRRSGPHSDAMQTFDNNGQEYVLTDVLIEGNTIHNVFSGGMFQGASKNVIWRSNVFINGSSHMLQVGVRDFLFEGNIFYLVVGLGISSTQTGAVNGNMFLWVRGTYSALSTIVGRNNWAYPTPLLLRDAVKTEPGGTVGVRPMLANLPISVFRTVTDGTASTLYIAPTDVQRLSVGSIIEINADGFARTVTALDIAGRVDFTPAISGTIARVTGSTLPADFGQWRIAAKDRFVGLWSTKDVSVNFSQPKMSPPLPPTNLRVVK